MNGKRVQGVQLLNHGERLRIGPVTFILALRLETERNHRPPTTLEDVVGDLLLLTEQDE